jgi:hypothetical protein
MSDLSDEKLRALYGALAADAPETPHPDPEHLADAALGRGSPESRLATFDHALSCAACRRELDLLQTVAQAGANLRQQRFRTRLVLATAAVVVVGIGLSIARRGSPVAEEERGGAAGDDTGRRAIELVAPVGPVAPGATPSLVWRRVPGASSYKVEIVSDRAAVVVRSGTSDTMLVWPSLPRGQTYRWRVSATQADGTVRRSPFTDLVVSPP